MTERQRLQLRRPMAAGILFLLTLLLAACAQEQASPSAALPTPLPTLPPAAVSVAPTTAGPGSGAPNAALPTPFVTARAATPVPETSPQQAPAPTAVPSATLPPEQHLQLGEEAFALLDYLSVIEHFSALLRRDSLPLNADEQADILFKLGQAYLGEELWVDAATIFNQLINLASADTPPATYFYLGQAYAAQQAHTEAVGAYTTYLDAAPELGGYVYPLIAEAQVALGNDAAAIAAYEAALEAPAYRIKEVATRLQLADLHLASGDQASAIAQYDAVHDLARTEATKGQMTYLAGAAELARGDIEAAFERFQTGLIDYPGAYESYLGLVELVKAEVPVDDFQRGLVDYNAAAYAPGIEAFEAYLASSPEPLRADALRYLALSHEALGDTEQALEQMALYADLAPQEGLLELAKLQARLGDAETAVTLYEQYVTDYPDAADAPFAAWWSAALSAQLGETDTAIERYERLAVSYPDNKDAAEALFTAGQLASDSDDPDRATELWLLGARTYPRALFGSAALLRLAQQAEGTAPDWLADVRDLAAVPGNVTYQALRAKDLLEGTAPFTAVQPLSLPADENDDLAAAEAWLADRFALDATAVSSELSTALAADDRLIVGQRLWELGLLQEARLELEDLRLENAADPLATYQLALFLRDLGLFRSSIGAAVTLLNAAGEHELEAPLAIARLSYPVYYADMILPLAEQYGFDPRLQFSLVRQESLFESFARSGAAAQGLSQVIPDTGAWIAERLQWPNYENDDLYKPYVGLNFGAYYLDQQLDYFNGDVHAALAAYNAGPGNAARWYEVAGSDLDQFVDTIDFPETEMYVERIYAGFNIYRALYEAGRSTAPSGG